MTTATEVLTYIRENFATQGKLQRQKLLYYAQAWHLAWNGEKLFDDSVTAWRMGPVVEDAWRRDPSGATRGRKCTEGGSLPEDARATLDSVVAFYGRFSGTELSVRSHREQPWLDAYEYVTPVMRGTCEIRPAAMRSFYALQAVENCERPLKPVASSQVISADVLDDLVRSELPRWNGVLALLAER